jgi:hypothetical protein
MSDKIVVEVDLDKIKVDKPFSGVEKEAKRSSKKVADTFSGDLNSAFGGIGAVLKKNIGLAVAAGAALTFKKSIDAAIIQEEAINDLNTALLLSGQYSGAVSTDFQNFASQLQKVTTFGDEAIISQIALAKSLGLTNDETKKVVTTAADLAARFNMDLGTATRELTKAMQGLPSTLDRQIPALKRLTKEQRAAGGALELLTEQFAGSASAKTRTYKGSLDQLGNSFGDILEGFGQFIVKNDAIIKVINKTTAILGDLAKSASASASAFNSIFKEDSKEEIDIVNKRLSESAKKINGIEASLKNLKDGFSINKLFGQDPSDSAFFKGLEKSLEEAKNQRKELLAQRADILNGRKNANKEEVLDDKKSNDEILRQRQELDNQLKAMGFMSVERVKEEFALKNEALKQAREIELIGEQEFIDQKLELKLQESERIRQIEERNLENSAKNSESLAAAFAVSLKKMDISLMQFANTLKNVFTAGLGNAFESMGAALRKGESLSKAFIDSVNNSLAEAASAAGDYYIKLGIAKIATGVDPTGPATLAGGLGLKTLAGFLGAAGSGSAVSSSPSGRSAQNGFGGFREEPTVEDRPQIRAPETSVVVNIQGDVLDSDESGLRVVDLINKAFDKQGISVRRGAMA